jgi:hypothetical protein
MNRTTMAMIMRFKESCRTSQNFSVPVSCFITAIDIIPPARATVKYAAISGIPCIMYLSKPIGKAESLDWVNMPIAAAITLAFQTKTKITPAPNMSENMSVNINT